METSEMSQMTQSAPLTLSQLGSPSPHTVRRPVRARQGRRVGRFRYIAK